MIRFRVGRNTITAPSMSATSEAKRASTDGSGTATGFRWCLLASKSSWLLR